MLMGSAAERGGRFRIERWTFRLFYMIFFQMTIFVGLPARPSIISLGLHFLSVFSGITSLKLDFLLVSC